MQGEQRDEKRLTCFSAAPVFFLGWKPVVARELQSVQRASAARLRIAGVSTVRS